MAERLIIFNSLVGTSTPAQLMAANLCISKYPDATLKDITGLTTGNVTTYISGLTNDYYTDIFICCATNVTPASNILSFDQVASLRQKMITASKGTTVRANTCQANVTTTEIILDASASAVNDFYDGMFIVTAGVTAVYRYISNYVGATVTATVADTSTAITSTETFIVYTNTNIYQLGNTSAVTGKTAAYQAWETLWPSTPAPLAVIYLGGYLFAECSGTASAAAAGTITLDATGASRGLGDRMTLAQMLVADSLAGYWVYIYSGTLGVWQKAQIESNAVTTAVCTLVDNWLITPTGTIIYRVVSNEERIRADRAMEIYAKTRWYDPSKLAAKQDITALTNLYGGLDVDDTEAPDQDLDLLTEMVTLGSFAFESDSTTYI
jgi:hypothetical protein